MHKLRSFHNHTLTNSELQVDKHFPHLTVGQTLEFAAAVRTPSHRPHETSRKDFAKYSAQVVMAVLGLSHTYNTKVGNDFVRGVSGGERKRVSVAEMLLAGAPFASWDNSTRGLDSATALKFVRSLRIGSDMAGGAAAVAIYQASQSVYDCFDKAAVLYEGRQIYFGPANKARDFFERQGWYCPRQTTGDFLTAVTNASERQPAKGFENKVLAHPRTLRSTGATLPSTRVCSRRFRNSSRRTLSANTRHLLRCVRRRTTSRPSMPGPSPHTSSVSQCRSSSTRCERTSASGEISPLLPPRPCSMLSWPSSSVPSSSVTRKALARSQAEALLFSWLFSSTH